MLKIILVIHEKLPNTLNSHQNLMLLLKIETREGEAIDSGERGRVHTTLRTNVFLNST